MTTNRSYPCSTIVKHYLKIRERQKERGKKVFHPPELVLFWFISPCATDNKGIIEGLDNFVMQFIFRVQVIQTSHQLVEPMPQSQLARCWLCGITGNAVRMFSSSASQYLTNVTHAESQSLMFLQMPECRNGQRSWSFLQDSRKRCEDPGSRFLWLYRIA